MNGVTNRKSERSPAVRSMKKSHVIIPTHSAHDTLAFAVLSAINQSLPPYRVTIIGDGVTSQVRKVAEELARNFTEVEFLDNPKLENRGEKHRDWVIKASDADFISYLCDDDLFMPNHLEIMSKHLEEFDFVHPRPTFFSPRGTVSFLLSGIESQEIRSWHSLEPRYNTISLTGASHTRHSYLSLNQGWSAAPPRMWTDLYMWVKFLGDPKVSTFTSPFTTTIKLIYSKENRELLNRSDLIEHWYRVTRQPEKLASLQREIESKFRKVSLAWRLARPLWLVAPPLRKLRSRFESFLRH